MPRNRPSSETRRALHLEMTALTEGRLPMADEWSVELPASRQAIVFADLVESVRLYERYESRTIEGWRRFAALARDQVAPAHGGRLVRTVGDSLLMVFESAAGAVGAAFALHRALEAFNDVNAPDQALWLRAWGHRPRRVR